MNSGVPVLNCVTVFYSSSPGVTAGGIAAVVGNPTEVSLVRMTLDGRWLCHCVPCANGWTQSHLAYRLPAEQRRGYSSAFNAMFRIAREEGVLTLWRVRILSVWFVCFNYYCSFLWRLQGCTPTVLRAMVVNAAQLATYSQAKQFLLTTGNMILWSQKTKLTSFPSP